jgi:predicted transcriptional regulator
MRKTKLEIYVGVLKILAQNDSVKTSNVADELNISTDELKIYLDFLLKQYLVDEQKLSYNRVVYSITQRGIRVLKYFKELKQELPINRDKAIITEPKLPIIRKRANIKVPF